MTAFMSDITARHKAYAPDVARLDDFTRGPAQEVAAEHVLTAPDWSIYGVDIERGQAMFAQMPPGTDLSTAAFVYMTQFDLARRVVVMPLDQMIALSHAVPRPDVFGMLFSTGRCGSTLASHILAQVPGVWSLSEPDVLEHLTFARFALPQDRMVPLLTAATRFLCHVLPGRGVKTVVIKPRSESMLQAAEYAMAVPEARNVFMYRDAETFTDSLYRFIQKMVDPEIFVAAESWKFGWKFASSNAPFALLDDFFPDGWQDIGVAEQMAVSWILRIEAYLVALDHGIIMQPLHYDDLNRNRRAETAKLLTAFGIPLGHLDLALQGFDKDSQEGAGGGKAWPSVPLDAAQRQMVRDLLTRRGMPDYRVERLPGGV